MRARRFRPSFDSLNLRITPSDALPGASLAAPTLSDELANPEELATIDEWDISDPNAPLNLDEPYIDPTQWDSSQ